MAQRAINSRPAEELRLRMGYEEFLASIDEDAHAEWTNGEAVIVPHPETKVKRLSRLLS